VGENLKGGPQLVWSQAVLASRPQPVTSQDSRNNLVRCVADYTTVPSFSCSAPCTSREQTPDLHEITHLIKLCLQFVSSIRFSFAWHIVGCCPTLPLCSPLRHPVPVILLPRVYHNATHLTSRAKLLLSPHRDDIFDCYLTSVSEALVKRPDVSQSQQPAAFSRNRFLRLK